jgi:2-dehydro-3-deoxyphosphogluconate aldolase/(4S)-4-hydroxy-2-oxoglutarate aldolase
MPQPAHPFDSSDRLLIGILRGWGAAELEQLVPACLRGGLRHLEITMNSPDAAGLIRRATRLAGDQLLIGAGTVLNEPQLDEALAAGARFIVTPVVCEGVVRKCVKLTLPVFPGAASPTEVVRAWELGATMVKVFPADQLGPSYFRNLKAPLPRIRLLPTGGVTLANLQAFLQAGADGVGVGSPLFDPPLIQAGDWSALEERCRAFVTALNTRHNPKSEI